MAKKHKKKDDITLSVTLKKKHLKRLLIILFGSNLVSSTLLLQEKVHLGDLGLSMTTYESEGSLKDTGYKGCEAL